MSQPSSLQQTQSLLSDCRPSRQRHQYRQDEGGARLWVALQTVLRAIRVLCRRGTECPQAPALGICSEKYRLVKYVLRFLAKNSDEFRICRRCVMDNFFLASFANLLKATLSFVVSVCQSVRVKLDYDWTDFHEI
jgi:hypothetical protein